MYILLTGLSHHTTPVQVREKFAFSTSEIEGIYKRFREQSPLEGIFILTTCNRTEVYAVARSIEIGQQYMREYLSARSGLDDEQLFPYVYQKNCYAAVEHLFNVASGLDSMVL
ncbi:MAG: glutamyl-tRNA reductase, partial [Syntrophomonadaceae bacterium]|nr:glutamyl-tRNA reductase [Syntrophomonadaceae bacterium]